MSPPTGRPPLPGPWPGTPDRTGRVGARGRRPARKAVGEAGGGSAGPSPVAALALAAVLAALPALPAEAATRWYNVEVIVFADLRSEGLREEVWPADPGRPRLEDAVELRPSPASRSADGARVFPLVPRSGLSLHRVWNSLRRSSRYRPLLHTGWRQPGLRRNAALLARVGGSADGDAGPPVVHGTVRLSVARYFEVDLDLLYHRPAAEPGAAPARFRLTARRRMRSGELHYFDHPMFGALVRVTRFR